MLHYIAIWNILRPFWYILWPFGNLAVIWYSFPHFGILRQEKSGNPGQKNVDIAEKNLSRGSSVLLFRAYSATVRLHSIAVQILLKFLFKFLERFF
jgi:hypothetical protein